jgi:tyrosyl-tRNA synthetase
MLERDDFSKRLKANQPISVHELLYPLAQAYDSVALQADFEFGGTDQKFNLLVGRDIMREYGLEPQVILTTPLLEGTGGGQKMSKSLGNYIAFTEPAEVIFGKVMSISDPLMLRYYELLTDVSMPEIEAMKSGMASGELHPMELKGQLGLRIVSDFYGPGAAREAREQFARVHQRHEVPQEVTEYILARGETVPALADLLVATGLAPSKSEAKRLIKAGAVTVDGQKVTEPVAAAPSDLQEYVLRCGKLGFRRIKCG